MDRKGAWALIVDESGWKEKIKEKNIQRFHKGQKIAKVWQKPKSSFGNCKNQVKTNIGANSEAPKCNKREKKKKIHQEYKNV